VCTLLTDGIFACNIQSALVVSELVALKKDTVKIGRVHEHLARVWVLGPKHRYDPRPAEDESISPHTYIHTYINAYKKTHILSHRHTHTYRNA
jgi:hypothetical protein